jgi:hypothetical protein
VDQNLSRQCKDRPHHRDHLVDLIVIQGGEQRKALDQFAGVEAEIELRPPVCLVPAPGNMQQQVAVQFGADKALLVEIFVFQLFVA